jgi:hypothetical protein
LGSFRAGVRAGTFGHIQAHHGRSGHIELASFCAGASKTWRNVAPRSAVQRAAASE